MTQSSGVIARISFNGWISRQMQLQVMAAGRRDKLRDLPPAEQSSSERSSSPSPGDTLPWNLPKHQRVKRSKSASGDVLDPAERAIIRIADDRTVEIDRKVLDIQTQVPTVCSQNKTSSVNRGSGQRNIALVMDRK
ncbi:Microtubule-actin cross-linking factor 1, isoforms 1/2/3/5 [Labeo rohita]|uniref:Microtubule-actin cross-linking factor 1, isoforms 1/2/3/5 n=1 Tax=Labeo rohita TaxID=84645 RepID=A0ABQ8LZR8_LABRO|nr:Microtubule-actin cross-linking factor 1, isoforms 1/2/3/5 [Labeo rohita]